MSSLFDLRFLVVLGKGGVGRSTISAALALAAARNGKRVLVAMCNSKERLSRLLEVRRIGSQIAPILPNIDAVNMEPAAALEQYGMMILKVRALYKIVLENRFVSAFLRGTPGLDAWALLGKAQFHARELDENGRPVYDLVILDAPSTGHGLDMLRVPRVIVDAAPPGLLRREAEEALALLANPNRCGLCLVTLPEELPTNETRELYAALREQLGLPVRGLIINRMLAPLFSSAERDWLSGLPEPTASDAKLTLLARVSRARAFREQVQESCVKRLRESIAAPCVELPDLDTRFSSRRDRDALPRHRGGVMQIGKGQMTVNSYSFTGVNAL